MEAAMKETSEKYEFHVRWQPFLLRPNMPPEGVPKPPVSSAGPRVGGNLKSAGEAVGIDFTGKAEIYPYTLRSHVLLEMAKDNPELQDSLAEKLFQAYFTDGSHLPVEDLLKIAESVGMNAEETKAAITSEEKLQAAYHEAMTWSSRAISGVPFFLMNGKKTFSGAQDSSSFVRMFEIISEKFPAGVASPKENT